jgi:hypothetical protein
VLTNEFYDAQANNLYGTLGPLCPWCSGLGRTLSMGAEGCPTRYASRCRLCGGIGVDVDQVRAAELTSLHTRLADLESRYGQLLASQGLADQGRMSRQYWMELIAWATASGTAVANTVTETIIFPNITVPANYLQDGRNLRIRATGQHSTLGSGTVTLLFSVRWGGVTGVVICKSAAMTQLISLTAAYWDLDVVIGTRTNGAAGTVMGNGLARVFGATAPTIGSATGAPAVGPMTAGGQITPAVATLDLTADTALSLTVTHGAASASNTLTGLQYTLESMN